MLFRSIKFQVTVALAIQAFVLIGVVYSTHYLLKLRHHDYIILNLSGQLRIISLTLITQSENYVTYAPRNYDAYHRDLVLFNTDLKKQLNDFDKIIFALKKRVISTDLVSYFYHSTLDTQHSNLMEEDIRSQWDSESQRQLDKTFASWEIFKQGIKDSLGTNLKEPRLEFAAKYIVRNKKNVITSTSDLSSAFRRMMEGKLQRIDTLIKSTIYIIIFVSIAILTILYFRIFKPIDQTVSGFKRIANGELNYQVKVNIRNEIGDMTIAFNTLTQRINSLFKLTDGINQANDLDSTLEFLLNKFNVFIPIDWLCFAEHDFGNSNYQISRIHCNCTTSFKEQEQFAISNSFYEYALDKNIPVYMQENKTIVNLNPNDQFIQILYKNNFKSLLLVPLLYDIGNTSKNVAVLVFSSKTENAYTAEHLELLNNITTQISHAVNKTIGLESLIISTVEGLAKLAESRDPETGDHLYRMSHYSRIIAQQLSNEGPYTKDINANYIRSILRFAPMHDIGKVGIGDYILLKPGALSNEERNTMQQHPVIGAEVLRRCEKQVHSLGQDIFKLGIEIAESHHEKFDGSGYPHKLIAKAIPLSARIVAVADVFDALTSKRPYKEAWSIEKTLDLMKQESGAHFDPDVISALEQAMPSILEIYNKHKHV